MKNLFISITLLICFFSFGLPATVFAKKKLQVIKLKMGTMAPRVNAGSDGESDSAKQLNKQFRFLEKRFGVDIDVTGYFGGVMGDDSQMIQKIKMGQLDMIGCTLEGLKLCASDIDTFCMAYLIENYGQFDYIMKKNSAFINNLFYKEGWISIIGIISEGRQDLCLTTPLKNPEELRKNLKAANYTGGPDNTFFQALGIPQTSISTLGLYPAFRTKSNNAGILASVFIVGLQIYTTLKYIYDPPIRFPLSSALLIKRKWDTLPWEFRIYLAAMQPLTYFFAGCQIRDMSIAFRNAMIEYGTKEVKLTSEELKAWKEPVIAYRETYLGNNKNKRDIYNRIIKSIAEYKSGYPIERAIYESDPTYASFYDKSRSVSEALRSYYKTGSKVAILKLTKDKIIEKWRLYDWIKYSEEYIKTGNPKKLKKWMKSFYISEVVDEMFSKHINSVKKVFGTKKALRHRTEEFLTIAENPTYKGFQRLAAVKKKK